jgi:hypothetical protein
MSDKDERIAKEISADEETYDRKEAGQTVRWSSNIGIHAVARSGCKTEMMYWFLTAREFKMAFSLDPARLPDIKMVKIDDETGTRKLVGVLLRPAPTDPPHVSFRRVYLWHDTVWLKDETVADPADRLRDKEPFDVFNGLGKSMAAQREKARCASYRVACDECPVQEQKGRGEVDKGKV